MLDMHLMLKDAAQARRNARATQIGMQRGKGEVASASVARLILEFKGFAFRELRKC